MTYEIDWEGIAHGYHEDAEYFRDRLAEVEAERDDYKAKYAELNGALSWGVTCLNCAKKLDESYDEYVKRDTTAQRELDELRRKVADLADKWDRPGMVGIAPRLRSLLGHGDAESVKKIECEDQ